jgi:glycerol-3-phosphate O-acyltransferase/dihydroxyacetone phosphate acyltransferase
MAEKSFQRQFVGGMAAQLGVVPVPRAMDIAKPSQGTIYIPDPVNNPRLLKGIGTNFMSAEFEVGGAIYLPTMNGDSQKLDIAGVIDSEELLLGNFPDNADARLQLTGKHELGEACAPGFMGTKFKVAARVDQTQVYAAVFEKLSDGGCIGIFPEGASHDRTELLPLKGKTLRLSLTQL